MTVIFSQLAPGGVPSSQSCAPLGYWCEWVSRVEDSSFSVLFESWSGRRVKTSKSKNKKNIKNFAWILLRGWIYIYIYMGSSFEGDRVTWPHGKCFFSKFDLDYPCDPLCGWVGWSHRRGFPKFSVDGLRFSVVWDVWVDRKDQPFPD